MEKKTYFISGTSKYDVKYFMRDYIPMLKQAVVEGANFVVGDCDGVDAMAQSFLQRTLPKEEHNRVKIFFKGMDPQNFLSTDFMPIGGFVSHEEASVAMTMCSDEDIACLEEGYWNSMTAKNILRRYTPAYNFKRWYTSEKRHKAFWDIILTEEKTKEFPENDRPALIID